MVAGARAEGGMEYLFNIDQDSAISEWFQASSVGNSGYVYGNYNICVRYNSANYAMETMMPNWPKNTSPFPTTQDASATKMMTSAA